MLKKEEIDRLSSEDIYKILKVKVILFTAISVHGNFASLNAISDFKKLFQFWLIFKKTLKDIQYDICMCFHPKDREEIVDLINKLKDEYTLTMTVASLDGQNLIKNSKLFICFLSLNFLNDQKCVEHLKFAFKFKKKVFLLKNDNHHIPASLSRTKLVGRSKSISLNYGTNEIDRVFIKKNIYDFFK